MGIRVIITGSTGMVGKGVLLECLDSNDVEAITVINRHTLGMTHPKLTEILHQDFLDISPITPQIQGFDACFLCMGVSSFGMKSPEFTNLTYNITTHMARILIGANSQLTCVYVSGTGTDSSEKGNIMWARVKGKTENDLLAMPFKAAYMFRAGYIQPLKGIKSNTKLYNNMYVIMKPLYPILNFLFPKFMTTTEEMGKAMINAVVKGYNKKHLENYDIRLLANS